VKTFIPSRLYVENGCEHYTLGKELLQKYKDLPITLIDDHNKIPELRERPDSDFARMKNYLVLGIRKSLTHQKNNKTSDFLVPYTSSGCPAMCLYCYLVCSYFSGSYLRVFVNREQMMLKLNRAARKLGAGTVFEIGSNSDLVIENTVTGNLVWTIEHFDKFIGAQLTLPTKFSMVDPLLPLDHKGRITIRMSLNPQSIIEKIELGTSALKERMQALIRLDEAGYNTGILVAPVILVDDWHMQYKGLFEKMRDTLPEKLLKKIELEVIFMTYGYAHRMINPAAFPKQPELFDEKIMSGCGRNKYAYKPKVKEEARDKMRMMLEHHFPDTKIAYIV